MHATTRANDDQPAAPPPARTLLRYPVYDLESAIEVARKIHERAGGQASTHELAMFLNYSGKRNGAFLSRLAATRMFGLIEGPAAAVRLTPRAHDIISPDYDEAAERSRLEAFRSVPLYAAFLREYEGKQLPPRVGMQNALVTKFGVPRKQAQLVLDRMLDSAEQAGLFRVAGDRSKLITPTLAGSRQGPALANGMATAPPNGSTHEEFEPATRAPARNMPRHAVKLIDGALELLPGEGEWDEVQLKEWLDLFEQVLRVVYRIPRPARQ